MPHEEIEALGLRLRKKFNKPDFLIDVKHDPALIGGASIVWQGVYYDFSIQKRIQDNRAQILERIKEFVTWKNVT